MTTTIDHETGEIIQADDAWSRHERIVSLRHAAEQTFLALGEELYWFEKDRQYATLGHPSFNSYLADPEVDIERSVAYRLKRVFETFQLGLSVAPGRLLPSGYHKLDAIASLVNADNVDEWLHKSASLSRSDLHQELIDYRRQLTADRGATVELPSHIAVHHGDFRDVLTDLPSESVDLIFTDPPYDRASIPRYGDMARIAARILKPGGSLVTYAGHYALPELIPLVSEHLRYWWILAMKHAGGSARLPGKWVFVEWKPLLWFVKDGRRDNRYVADFIQSHQPTKEEHDWQQDLSEAAYLIEQLTDPGELVVDPFCGSGTTLIAAATLNRRAIGVEIDGDNAKRAKARIQDYARSRAA